jgi:hypothetical protein
MGSDYGRRRTNCKLKSFQKSEASPRTLDSRLVVRVNCPNPPPPGLRSFKDEFIIRVPQAVLLFIRRRVDALTIIGSRFFSSGPRGQHDSISTA